MKLIPILTYSNPFVFGGLGKQVKVLMTLKTSYNIQYVVPDTVSNREKTIDSNVVFEGVQYEEENTSTPIKWEGRIEFINESSETYTEKDLLDLTKEWETPTGDLKEIHDTGFWVILN